MLGGGELFALALSRTAKGGGRECGAVPMEEPKEDKENDTQKMNRNGNPNVPRWWPVLPCTESDREVRDHCGFVYKL